MQAYYGTKLIHAEPGPAPANLLGDHSIGYKVIYSKDTPQEYISWSPQNVFEESYQPADAMSFGHALQALKDGFQVTRGNGVIFIQVTDVHSKMQHPYLYVNPGDGNLVPWTPSQVDLFANDWAIEY